MVTNTQYYKQYVAPWQPPGTLNGPSESASNSLVGATTLVGNIGGGYYAYKSTKGNFWWTLFGIVVGGIAGNAVGQIVTYPTRQI